MPDRSPIGSTTKVNPHLVEQIHQIFDTEPYALATIDYIAAYTKNLKGKPYSPKTVRQEFA